MALDTNLISFWNCDESSGNLVDALSLNTLTNNNSTPFVTGLIGNAADLERSSSQSFSISNASQTGLNLTGGNFTWAFWLKLEQLPSTAGGNMHLNNKTGGGATNRVYEINLLSTNFCRVAISADGSADVGKFNTTDSNAAIVVSGDVGNWAHIAVTYLDSTDTVTMYKNGSSVASTKLLSKSTLGIFNGTADFQLGFQLGAEYYDGLMDMVGVWSRTLSGAEIGELYNGGAGLQYPFAAPGPSNMKSYNTNLRANIKTMNTNPIANVKSFDTNV